MKQFSRNKLNLACIHAIAVLTFSAQSALAAEETKEAATDDIEVIQVTGLRGSLFEAVNRKRFSEVISDSIVAEDIGKMPDRNIAEALQRIPGISINRENGEGTDVTIRGIAPNLNLTTINGTGVASAGNGRGIDFSSMPSSMISAIEVYKTPEASHMEGSIGGTINIITARPLDVGESKGTAFVEAVYTENNEETTPAFAFSYTTPITDTFGIAVAVSHEQINTRNDFINNDSWAESDKGHYPTRWSVGTTNREVERDSLMLNLQWQPTDALNLFTDLTYSKVSEEREEPAFTTWFPSGYADIVDSSVVTNPKTNTVTEFIADSVYIQTADRSLQAEIDTLTFQLGGEYELDNLTIKAGVAYSEAETDELEQTIYNYDHWYFNGDRHDAKYIMGADNQWGYYDASADGYPEFYDPSVQFNHADEKDANDMGDYSAMNRLVQGSLNRDPRKNTDEDISAHIDFEYALDDNDYISSVEAGIRWNKRSKTTIIESRNLGPWEMPIEAEDGSFPNLFWAAPLFHDELAERYDPVNFAGGNNAAGVPTGWNAINSFDAAEANMMNWMNGVFGFTDDGVGSWLNSFDDVYELSGQTPDRRGSANNVETTFAAYAQANLYLLDGDLTGNIGVRYVTTDIESDGLTGTTYNARNGGPLNELHYENDYSNILPSLNLSYKLQDDMVLRFAAATVIARPDFNDARAGGTSTTDGWMELDGSEDPDWGVQDEDSYVDGNIELDPYEANQFDVSYEYYFSETGMFSAGVFYKDISSFIYSQVERGGTVVDGLETEQFTRLPYYTQEDFECQCNGVDDPIEYDLIFESYSRPVNGDGGYISGLELSFLTTLEVIPGMENFGVQANYTLAASEADYAGDSQGNDDIDLPFENQSEHSYNLAGFYESDDLMVRLAYNWRSESLRQVAAPIDNYAVWNDSYGQLDASFSYNITETISVIGSISNVLEESRKAFKTLAEEGNILKGDSVPTDRNSFQTYSGRTFRLGISATF